VSQAAGVGALLACLLAPLAFGGERPATVSEAEEPATVSEAEMPALASGAKTPATESEVEVPASVSEAHAAYTEAIPGTKVRFDMVPVPAGSFLMGSPPTEAGRSEDEGGPVTVKVGAFWMGRYEVTWEEYDLFAIKRRTEAPPSSPSGADAVTRPTPPYADESFGYGKGRQPALGMSHHAAMEYCRWLSERTGRRYRLPTEAEWEYACRAGTASTFGFGDDGALAEHAWSAANADDHPRPVGKRKPNGWGLFDMNGNIAEWVLDRYSPSAYADWAKAAAPGTTIDSPVVLPDEKAYPHVVRGGSWDDPPPKLRCAARRASSPSWNRRDPQRPQSLWWLTDATHVGFRVVRAVDEAEALAGLRSKVTKQSP
jgi:formylglycine-generating enzyme required for sulfatase activity